MGTTNYKIYTPYRYSKEITKEAFRKYFKKDYSKEKLKNLRMIDLSSGTGNLLCIALEKLIKLSKKVFGEYKYYENWITAYDLDEKALEEYRENIEKILKKYNLSGDIKFFLKDSLKTEISEKYNIVLGNPPYIGEKNNKKIFDEIKETDFGKKYYQSKMDYFYFFIEKGVDILEENGVLSYIVTNYWLKADSATILREKLKSEGEYIYINNFNSSVFKDADGQHNMIFTWKKSKNNERCLIKNFSLNEKNFKLDKTDVKQVMEEFYLKNTELYDSKGNIILTNIENKKLSEKILEKSNFRLGEILNINQGIISGYDKAFVFSEFPKEYEEYIKPFYKSKDIFKYSSKEKNDFWILYLDRKVKPNEKLLNYLEDYQEKLKNRREVKSDRIKWWELQWGRDREIFSGEKIVVRQRCKTNIFAYSDGDFFGSADIYYLSIKNREIDIFYLLGYLNSEIFYKWYRINGKSKGYNLEFYSTPLKETPIFYPHNIEEIKYISNLVKKQVKNYSEEIQREIEEYFSYTYSI